MYTIPPIMLELQVPCLSQKTFLSYQSVGLAIFSSGFSAEEIPASHFQNCRQNYLCALPEKVIYLAQSYQIYGNI